MSTTPGQSLSAKSESNSASSKEGRHTRGRPHDFEYLQQLIPLEGDVLFTIQLGLLSLEYGTQACQFCHDTPDGPAVDSLSVMLRSQQELRCTVPYRNNNLVTSEQGLQGLVYYPCQPQVSDLDDTGRRDKDVCGLDIAVQDVA